ncbi:bifunctional UDP-N-acetylglucosamine diphosphorylase/glucosamine-1-phosphate N-acetyltransferase GlmU [Fusibacter bizertensis]|jgi:UDP-N-acetylglucosamine pyrophosphorylase (EC 2.7.7.23)/glucosamine-1-phosphate N-acetyltransferase (EC 2.3.1.157)|uniref:Bifunctional protein GlmU n=1 Tax=Fusibacter bizertensis TaxID=1488331 RepID=A0ABT6NGS5_9FIRM|nr:bifunctional UDP-N-acetylglucosamine diphosphorylase/glucosamine-1-phosphate N-acetyltransferase GlmU [Fusibacter bizertensis]MDH8679635.1 bifunctional UDP-N-acetylglucosamine diphosphorylase/glucosamine-1-phosphate N-acetyltransferase GlmU [Fusibacter bizertensis]
MDKLITIILAAGYGKRMKSKLPKVLHKVSGVPMIQHVVDLANEIGTDETVCVVGHGRELVESALANQNIEFAVQEVQLGTGHAVKSAQAFIDEGLVLVLFGDAPLLSASTLKAFITNHKNGKYKASLISTFFDDPTGYGRIVRDQEGNFDRIIEHKDASEDQKRIGEINSGIGLFDASILMDALDALKNNNSQGEYYLTDVFEYVKEKHGKVDAFVIKDAYEVMGINDRMALAEAEKYHQDLIKKHWMREGVTLISPESIYIEKYVTIGQDTIIEQGTMLKGSTVIGEDCHIGPFSEVIDTKIGNEVKVKHSTLTDSSVDDRTVVGPYAYLRPKSNVGKDCKIGDFVEVKNSTIGDSTKISHLTYVGDGKVGKNVNLGCGVVFVNYDGVNKHLTEIEDDVFVGCNTNLIAPVKVGKEAYIAAGSTITQDVPEKALGIARERQVNKTDWSNKYLKKK